MRVLAVAFALLCATLSALTAQELKKFDAGPDWFGLSFATPRGERFCSIIRAGISPGLAAAGFSIRMSKLSTMLQFSDGSEGTGPARSVPIVFRISASGEAAFEITGEARETPGPGNLISYFYEAPPAATFLDQFATGEAVTVTIGTRNHGPFPLGGIGAAMKALRACFASL